MCCCLSRSVCVIVYKFVIIAVCMCVDSCVCVCAGVLSVSARVLHNYITMHIV